MKPEQISDALNLLDEDIIQETEQLRKRPNRANRNQWKGLGVIAACLGLFMVSSLCFKHFMKPPVAPINPTGTENSEPTMDSETNSITGSLSVQELPMITLSGAFGNLGSGFDEIVSDDIIKLTEKSPWRENLMPERMPIFDNKYYTEDYVPYGYTKEEMEAKLKQIVFGLGAELIISEYIEATQYASAYLTANTTMAKIKLEGNGAIEICFEPQEALEGYCVKSDMAVTDIICSIYNLIEHFEDVFGYIEPAVEIITEYNYLGNCKKRYISYEDAGDLTEKLIHRQYDISEFIFNEFGNLEMIRIKNGLSCAEQLEEYPIISAEDARQLLLNGHYFSQGSKNFTFSEEHIDSVELMYPSSQHPETIIPYYCFYVEDTNTTFNTSADPELIKNLTIYRKCYVPAVDEEYIENMPQN